MMRRIKEFSLYSILVIAIWTNHFVKCASIDGLQAVSVQRQPEICRTKACKSFATEVKEKMNRTVNPCDDFYEYVCGNYSKNTIIPDDQPLINSILLIRKKVQAELKTSLENEISQEDPKTLKMLKSYYNTCMDEDQIERNGEKDLLEILKNLGGWPVLAGESWINSSFGWIKLVQKFRDIGYSQNVFIGVEVDIDVKNNSQRIIYIDQASLGISQEFLSQGLENSVVRAYSKYMVDLAVIFGADKDQAKTELAESLNFEMELANISLSSSQRRNMTALYNPMTIDELQSRYSFVPWQDYMNRILHPHARLRPNEVISVTVPGYLEKLSKLIKKTSKRVLANYAFWRIVKESAANLGHRVRNAQRKYYEALSGNANKNLRWQECVDQVGRTMPFAIGALYVRRHFDKKSKDSMMDMIAELKKSFRLMLIQADWMDEFTKKQALEKLDGILPLVAYPDELLNNNVLDDYHKNIDIHSDSFLKTTLSLNAFTVQKEMENLRKPVVKSVWTTTMYGSAATVNARYQRSTNSFQFPAGFLQEPIFNSEYPNYINYAGIGFVVGHEMTHGFDDSGRKYDKNGNLVDWWDPRTEKEYLKRAECIVKQYSNYTVEEVNLKLDGAQSQGENIADNGGLREAYLAYDSWLRVNGDEPRLPGFEAYTPKQMFWISNANIWCTKHRLKYLANEIVTDVHSPPRFRVIGPLSNMPEFATDFNCPVGTNMNPVNKCAIW